jgi:hypothetical protein
LRIDYVDERTTIKTQHAEMDFGGQSGGGDEDSGGMSREAAALDQRIEQVEKDLARVPVRMRTGTSMAASEGSGGTVATGIGLANRFFSS